MFFSKYLDNYCRYQYCANDTLFRNISCILRSIFQDSLPKKDVAFCETTDTAHSYIMCLSMLKMVSLKTVSGFQSCAKGQSREINDHHVGIKSF